MIRLRQDLLDEQDYKSVIRDLVEQLNRVLGGSSGDPYSFESKPLDDELKITSVTEEPTASDRVKVTIVTEAHSFLYECRYKTEMEPSWRRWVQADNVFTFEIDPGNWIAQLRVRRSPNSNWSRWATARGSGEAIAAESTDDLTELTITPPPTPTATATYRGIKVTWGVVEWSGLAQYLVYRGTTPNFDDAHLVTSVVGPMWTDVSVEEGSTYYYWVRAQHKRGFISKPAGPASATARKIISDDLYDQIIKETHVASDLRFVKVLDTLPSLPNDNYPQGSIVFLTSDNKLYRSTGSSWTCMIPTSDLYGLISTEQIQDYAIDGTKIAAGAVSLLKFADGIRPVQVVSSLPSLPHSDYPQGAVVFLSTDNKLYRSTGTSWTAAVPTLDLVGQITTDQIEDSSITASKIRNASIEETKLAAGAVSLTKFADGIRPIQVVSTLPTLPHVDYPQGAVVFLTNDNKLYRSTGDGWTAVVPATDLAGQITSAQIENGSITDIKIASGAVSLTKFASGLRPVQLVSSLPSLPNSDYPQGAVVFLTTDNKLYRSTGNSWTAAVPTSDLSGQVTGSQILDGSITELKIASGAVSLTKFANGLRPIQLVSSLPSLPNSSYPQGAVVFLTTENKLYRSTGTSWVASVPTSDLSGQITTSQIEDGAVTASKLLNGSVTELKLASGAVSLTKFANNLRPIQLVSSLPSLPDSNYPQGAVVFLTTENKLYRSTGTSWVASVPTSDLTGQITETQIANDSISTPKIKTNAIEGYHIKSNSISSAHIQSDAIEAGHIKAGAVGTDELAAEAVTAQKIKAGEVYASKLNVAQIFVEGLNISDNSPSSGFVSWNAHTIYYQGAGYSISGGSTNNKYVYWNVGDSSLTSSNTKPSWSATRFMIFINDNGLHRLVWNATLIHGGTIVSNSITADEIAANSITVSKLSPEARMVFADTFDGTFDWSKWGVGEITVVSSDDAITGGKILRVGDNSGDDTVYLIHKALIPYDPNCIYRIRVRFRRVAGDGSFYAGFAGVAGDGTTFVNINGQNAHWNQHYHAASGLTSDSWYLAEGYTSGVSSPGQATAGTLTQPGTMHVNTRYLRPAMILNTKVGGTSGITEVDMFAVEIIPNQVSMWAHGSDVTKIDGGEIYTGSITANQIAANAITAGKIAAGVVGTNELAADAVTAQKIKAGEVYASKLNVAQIFVEALTVSNNSPSSGYVSWTAHTIYYQGASYSISSGNTNNRYIYWNVGDASLSTSNTKPSWASNRFMIMINDAGIHRLVWNATLIHGGAIITGTITADEIASGSITSDHIQANAIEAGHIKSGAVGTDELAADAVTAAKIRAGEIYASKLNVAQVFVDGLSVSNNTPSSGYVSWNAHTVYFQGTSYSISSGNTNKKYVYWDVGNTSLTASDSKPSWTPTRFMILINDSGTHRLVWNATLIHGGAVLTGTITADEIAANSITSSHIQADAIEAGHIKSGAVGTDELAAEAVTAQKIKAGEVYASKLNVAQIFVDGLSMSNNTPSAGSVSWTSHTIYYQGTAYLISSGSTSDKYIYWDVGNSFLSAASTKPSWSSTRFMIAINDGGYYRIIWNATYIHGGTIVSNSITADEIAANSITVSKLSPEARMVFADTFDGSFDWVTVYGSGEISVVSVSDSITGGKILRLGNNSGNDEVRLVHKALIPYEPDCIYRIRCRVRRTNGSGTFYAGFAGVAADGTTWVNVDGENNWEYQHYHAAYAANPGTSWTLMEGYTSGTSTPGQRTVGTLTQPGKMHVNVRYLRPILIANTSSTGITEVDMFTVEVIPNQVSMWAHGSDVTKIDGGEIYTRSITASQIASGTITANEIAAGTITAANIQARSITGDRLVAGAISGSEIAADAIEANHIKGGSIYASKLSVAQIFVDGLSMFNNPSTGSVSWTAHTIYYQGTAYSISSGSTSYKYIYWNVGDNFLSASDTKPEWSPTRFMIAINNSGVHSLVWNATIIHGGAIVTGSITADEIAANAIVAGKIAAGAVGTNELAADSVVGDKIASNQISSRHIVTEGLVAVPIRTASNGPRVEIFPDENTGLAIWAPNDQLAMSVFTGQSGGFGPGDIYVGSAAAGKYMYWSASDQVLNVRGRIEADNINGFDSEDFERAIANALGLDDFSLSWEDVYNAPISSDYSLGSFTNITLPSTYDSDDTQAVEIVNNKLNLRRGYVVAQSTVTGLTWNLGDGVGDPPTIMTKVSVAHGTVLTGFVLRLKRVGSNESKTATARIWTYLNGGFTARAAATVYLKDLPTSTQEVMFWMGSDYAYDSAHGEVYIGITTSNTNSGTYIIVSGGIDSNGTLYKFGSFVSGKSLYYKLKKRAQTSGKRAWYVFSSPLNLSNYTRLKLSLQSPVNLSGKVQLYIQNGTTDQYINFPSMIGNNASEFVIFDISSTGRDSVGRIGFKALQDMEDDYVVSLSLLEAMTPNEKVKTRAPWDPSTYIYVATEREIRPAANAIVRRVSATSLKVIFPFFPDWIPVDLTWSTSYTTGKYHVQMRKGITGQPVASDFLISSSIDPAYDLIATLYHQNGTGFAPFYMPSPREVVYANNGFRILTNGGATSWTNVSLASYVPTGRCVVARLRVSTASNGPARVILRSPVLQETRETYLHYTDPLTDYPFTWGIEEILTDTSGNIQYTKGYVNSSVTLDLLGYKDWEK